MCDDNLTLLVNVFDRSFSMRGREKFVEDGFWQLIKDQKNLDAGKIIVSLNQFDTEFEELAKEVSINEVRKFKLIPRGDTALNDAIGYTIDRIGQRLAARPENKRPGRILLNFWTDGQENSSREYSACKVKEMIEHQRSKYNWIVNFLGGEIDSVKVGRDYGIARGSCLSFANNAVGTKAAYSSLSQNVSNLRSMDCEAYNLTAASGEVFTSADWNAQIKAGLDVSNIEVGSK